MRFWFWSSDGGPLLVPMKTSPKKGFLVFPMDASHALNADSISRLLSKDQLVTLPKKGLPLFLTDVSNAPSAGLISKLLSKNLLQTLPKKGLPLFLMVVSNAPSAGLILLLRTRIKDKQRNGCFRIDNGVMGTRHFLKGFKRLGRTLVRPFLLVERTADSRHGTRWDLGHIPFFHLGMDQRSLHCCLF